MLISPEYEWRETDYNVNLTFKEYGEKLKDIDFYVTTQSLTYRSERKFCEIILFDRILPFKWFHKKTKEGTIEVLLFKEKIAYWHTLCLEDKEQRKVVKKAAVDEMLVLHEELRKEKKVRKEYVTKVLRDDELRVAEDDRKRLELKKKKCKEKYLKQILNDTTCDGSVSNKEEKEEAKETNLHHVKDESSLQEIPTREIRHVKVSLSPRLFPAPQRISSLKAEEEFIKINQIKYDNETYTFQERKEKKHSAEYISLQEKAKQLSLLNDTKGLERCMSHLKAMELN